MKFKTAKAALAYSLLKGQTINVKNCFSLFGLTNAAREIPRMIERPFNLSVTRTQQEGASRFGQKSVWMDYSLNKARQSPEALQALQSYVEKNTLK